MRGAVLSDWTCVGTDWGFVAATIFGFGLGTDGSSLIAITGLVQELGFAVVRVGADGTVLDPEPLHLEVPVSDPVGRRPVSATPDHEHVDTSTTGSAALGTGDAPGRTGRCHRSQRRS